MTLRTFAIPCNIAGLSLLAGCGPAIVGEWSLDSLKVDGETVDLSSSYSGSYYSYTFEMTGTLTVDKDLTGDFEIVQDFSYDGGSYSYEVGGDVEAEQVETFDFNTFAVKIDVDDGTEFDLECVVDKGEMDCSGDIDGETPIRMGWTLED